MVEAIKRNFAQFISPVVTALKELGGSSKPQQVYEQIQKDIKVPDELLNSKLKNGEPVFKNQVRWAREYLRRAGYIDGSVRGVWTLTDAGKNEIFNDENILKIVNFRPEAVKEDYEDVVTDLLHFYKESFKKHWEDEKYKWQAVKWFQDNWNIDADDFSTMFKLAVKKADNLLSSFGSYPAGQIQDFARENPQKTKDLFEYLYDESKDLEERITHFKIESDEILSEHNKNHPESIWKTCYQNENSISTYLWLKYPDKYYIYKFGEVKNVENLISDSPVIKKGQGVKNLIAGKELYDQLCEIIKDNDEIIDQFEKALTEDCYKDPEYRTLTIDFCFQVSRYYLDTVSDSEVNAESSGINYWLYSPGKGALKWEEFTKKGIIAIGWGELGEVTTETDVKEKMKEIWGENKTYKNDALAVWQFANKMKPGDIVFAKGSLHSILGYGIVTSGYQYDKKMPEAYNHVHKIDWKETVEKDFPKQLVQKTLTRINPYTELVESLCDLYEISYSYTSEPTSVVKKTYTKEDFLNEVFMSEEKYNTLVNLIIRKKNIILQGAPGVGKTFAAKRLAYSMLGEVDPEKVKMIQFHQSYSYEDFIVGFRPAEDEKKQFEKKYGVFYNFCKEAEQDTDPDSKYFFIIDEINRGNLGKIFGELLMLIEKDKRGQQLQLLYSNELFSVPANVYIIGMMNTADRSLAIIDYALRRRFAFVEFNPAFEANSKSFEALKEKVENPNYIKLINMVVELNHDIEKDPSLGKGFRIGHSYFIPETPDEVDDVWLNDIIDYEIVPLLEEYWFDEPEKLDKWSKTLKDSIK